MQHSLSSEVQSSSAIQEIPRTWWNLEVLYHAHKGPVLIHIIMQTNPVKTDSFFFMTHFNIILQSTHAISKCFFPPPPKKKLCMHLSFACHIHALVILLDLISQLIFGQGNIHTPTKNMKIFQNYTKYMYTVVSNTEVWKGALLSVSHVLSVIQPDWALILETHNEHGSSTCLVKYTLRKISNNSLQEDTNLISCWHFSVQQILKNMACTLIKYNTAFIYSTSS